MISKTIFSIASASLLVVSSALAGGASITGKVNFTGKPPAEAPIKLDGDPKCKASHKTPVTTRHYVVDSNGNLANVFVYVKDGLGSQKFTPPSTPAVLDQNSCLYSPYVMGVQAGQKLIIQNSDDTLHNVHAMPEQKKNAEFNIGQPVKGMKSEKVFTKPEVFVKFKCDVHSWMLAYVGVVEHPFFAVTQADGTYKIDGLPDGEYTLAAVHPKAGEKTAKVKVAGGKAEPANFTFQAK